VAAENSGWETGGRREEEGEGGKVVIKISRYAGAQLIFENEEPKRSSWARAARPRRASLQCADGYHPKTTLRACEGRMFEEPLYIGLSSLAFHHVSSFVHSLLIPHQHRFPSPGQDLEVLRREANLRAHPGEVCPLILNFFLVGSKLKGHCLVLVGDKNSLQLAAHQL